LNLSDRRRGVAAALGAFLLWGILPLYFVAIAQVPTYEIVANRIGWSAVLVTAIVLARGQGPALLRAIRNRRHFLGLVGSSICITVNWSFFAWAIPHGHALDAGFGYLVNPLVNVLLGFVVLRERLPRTRAIAVLLAAAGVAALAYGQGGVPWIVLVLPISFGLYGLLRKVVAVDALVGLAVEVLLMAPFAWAYIATRPGGGAFLGQGPGMTGMLLLGAPITAVPLFLFAYGARRMPLATLGVLQYVAPTLQLILASLFFGETVTWADGVAFGLIWAGIAIYSFPVGKGVDNGLAGGQIAGRVAGD
jgi:chloramphenicol-sensitive protein RarD